MILGDGLKCEGSFYLLFKINDERGVKWKKCYIFPLDYVF